MRRTHRYKGWMTAISVIGMAAIVIPTIGAQASTQRDNVKWAAVAAEFRASEVDIVAFTQIETPRLRDAADIRTLSPLGVEHRRWAEKRASEYQCLAEAVYYEARSESRSGQLAVADVVKNRVKSKHYPNTICGVVYEGAHRPFACQFTFACDGAMEIAPKGQAWERSQETHYHTLAIHPLWAETLEYKATIGFHKFYRPSWRERNSGTTTISIAPPT